VRILTVRQPWAWAIIHGGKDVENRVRNIAGSYRGPVAIHAALKADEQALRDLPRLPPNGIPRVFEYGAIIGVVDLVDVHSASVIGGCGRMDNHCDEHPNGCRHHCSPWAMGPAPEGWYQHLVLANPRELVRPIPYRGALGLRPLDPAVVAQIESVGFITPESRGANA
jgi:hypothetical protein